MQEPNAWLVLKRVQELTMCEDSSTSLQHLNGPRELVKATWWGRGAFRESSPREGKRKVAGLAAEERLVAGLTRQSLGTLNKAKRVETRRGSE